MNPSEYERTLDSAEYAKTVLENCFIVDRINKGTRFEKTVYLVNFLKIQSIYYICHLVCEGIPNTEDIDYYWLSPECSAYIYKSFKAIAENKYQCEVCSSLNEKGTHVTWVPDDKSIPQWIFDIVANSINIMKP